MLYISDRNRKLRSTIFIALAVLNCMGLPQGLLRVGDEHKRPHSLARLPYGETHYILQGNPAGKLVVLVHGFSGDLSCFEFIANFLVKEGGRHKIMGCLSPRV